MRSPWFHISPRDCSRFGHDRLEVVAEIDDHVAALETLDGAVDQLAFAVDIFVVNLFANGLADLLNEDLLRSLGRDPAHLFLRKRDLEHISDLDLVACQLLRFDERKLRRVVLQLPRQPSSGAEISIAPSSLFQST